MVSREQLLAAGWQPHDIRRAIRGRELTAVHRGVYVDHTGPLTWLQRAWAAVLYAWPAALAGESALRAGGVLPASEVPGEPIVVAIDATRRVIAPEGVEVRRVVGMPSRVSWHLGPPRVSVEHAALDVASRKRRELDAVAVLAQAVGSRRTTADRLRAALDELPSLAGRAWLGRIVDDLSTGTHSVLEHGYLTRVERPHGLPSARRQVRHVGATGVGYRDAEALGGRVVIELDGRLHHDSARQRDRDLDRDLDAVSAETVAVRLGWGQVFDRPCSTAGRIATVLRRCGWSGEVVRCGDDCSAA